MSKLLQHIEEMRARLSEVSDSEQTLIRALGEALSRVDQKLMNDVRSITIEHEARRVAILTELQTLASRIGAFPLQHDPVPQLEEAGAVHPSYAAPSESLNGRGADWREAASRIEDEIDYVCGRRAPSH